MLIPNSRAVETLPEPLQAEYSRVFGAANAELQQMQGAKTIHAMLVERLAFIYCLMRSLETDVTTIDLQRYNQLLQLWLKIGTEMLNRYKELVESGALKDTFISQVMMIIADEIPDQEQMDRIRERLRLVAKEEAVAG